MYKFLTAFFPKGLLLSLFSAFLHPFLHLRDAWETTSEGCRGECQAGTAPEGYHVLIRVDRHLVPLQAVRPGVSVVHGCRSLSISTCHPPTDSPLFPSSP